MTPLRIDIWSDIACPWCYVGKRRLEAALSKFAERERIQISWRSFELNPDAGERESGHYAERLARKYRTSRAEAEGMIARMVEVGRGEGLTFDLEHIKPTSTFDAHRLIHLAQSRGVQGAMKERLFAAYFTEGALIDDADTLVHLACEVGLDPEEVGSMLRGDAWAKDVRLDEREAEAIGIRGVPFFVLGGRYAVSGAQPADVLLEALEKAHSTADASRDRYATGASCGPDGC